MKSVDNEAFSSLDALICLLSEIESGALCASVARRISSNLALEQGTAQEGYHTLRMS